jgi:hypothetical protein
MLCPSENISVPPHTFVEYLEKYDVLHGYKVFS